jgi:hypothetical protein
VEAEARLSEKFFPIQVGYGNPNIKLEMALRLTEDKFHQNFHPLLANSKVSRSNDNFPSAIFHCRVTANGDR